MVKRVLMIAYHYPPVGMSSGIQRTLKFSQYLPAHDWEPHILTVHPRAYPERSDAQIGEIPAEATVCRAFALDAARHLSVAGRYPLLVALPDRWSSWVLGGIVQGIGMIRKCQPQVIWSTYPIATAHLIGLVLHRLTGLPWIADCRDSITEEHYPADPTRRRIYRWIEKQAVSRALRVVFTTPGTARMYAERYPEIPASRWVTILNGYDEENFRAAEKVVGETNPGAAVTLVHSGILYPSERNPTHFFQALAELRKEGLISEVSLRIRLRATGHENEYRPQLKQYDISDIVKLEPPIPYNDALGEMLGADGLLIFQATNCNHQIPAKLYEYFRARRPILALTDPAGDTANAMMNVGIDTIVPLDDSDAIKKGLINFLTLVSESKAPIANDEIIVRYSRRSATEALAKLLDEASADLAE